MGRRLLVSLGNLVAVWELKCRKDGVSFGSAFRDLVLGR